MDSQRSQREDDATGMIAVLGMLLVIVVIVVGVITLSR